jgi:hypothetical protein
MLLLNFTQNPNPSGEKGKMNKKEAVKILKLYLKVADAFYATQISMGAKFTKGRLKFRQDIKDAINYFINTPTSGR